MGKEIRGPNLGVPESGFPDLLLDVDGWGHPELRTWTLDQTPEANPSQRTKITAIP